MEAMQYKEIHNSVKDVDLKTRRVRVAVGECMSKDLDNEVIDDKAYTKTIAERGPKGSNLIWHLTDHMPMLKSAVGKPTEISMEGSYLTFLTNIPDTTWGNDVMAMYDNGSINQHSVGFRSIKSEPVNAGKPDEYRLIKEIMLYEGSAVLWGANPNTPTLTVGKSLTKEQTVDEYKKTIDELNRLSKMFKTAYLTDETYGLIELKISQLSDRLQTLFDNATQPVDETVKPVNNGEDLLKHLTTIQNSLKRA